MTEPLIVARPSEKQVRRDIAALEAKPSLDDEEQQALTDLRTLAAAYEQGLISDDIPLPWFDDPPDTVEELLERNDALAR